LEDAAVEVQAAWRGYAVRRDVAWSRAVMAERVQYLEADGSDQPTKNLHFIL
jgi:hypothetical protein